MSEARRARSGATRSGRTIAGVSGAGTVPGAVDRAGRNVSFLRWPESSRHDVPWLVNGSRHRVPRQARRRVRAAATDDAASFAVTLAAILVATAGALAIGTGLAYLVGFVLILLGGGA